jgi:hypothetical protein
MEVYKDDSLVIRDEIQPGARADSMVDLMIELGAGEVDNPDDDGGPPVITRRGLVGDEFGKVMEPKFWQSNVDACFASEVDSHFLDFQKALHANLEIDMVDIGMSTDEKMGRVFSDIQKNLQKYEELYRNRALYCGWAIPHKTGDRWYMAMNKDRLIQFLCCDDLDRPTSLRPKKVREKLMEYCNGYWKKIQYTPEHGELHGCFVDILATCKDSKSFELRQWIDGSETRRLLDAIDKHIDNAANARQARAAKRQEKMQKKESSENERLRKEVERLQSEVTALRSEVTTLREGTVQVEVKKLKKENEDLKAEVEFYRSRLQLPGEEELVPNENEELTPVTFLWHMFKIALAEARGANPSGRRFSEGERKLGYIWHGLSAKCYRAIRPWVPMPAGSGLASWAKVRHESIRAALLGVDEDLRKYVNRWREANGMVGVRIAVTVGFDATSATHDPLGKKSAYGRVAGYIFAFLILPMNGDLKNLVIHSIYSKQGNMTKDILAKAAWLIKQLKGVLGFDVWCKATDGDRGMDDEHKQFFALFKGHGLDLKLVVAYLRTLFKGGRPNCCPTADGLHYLKTARNRIVQDGPPVCVSAKSKGIVRESMAAALGDAGNSTDFAKGAGSLLDDRVAVEAFRARNVIAAGEACDVAATYYLTPYVALMESIRFGAMTVVTRLRFLEVAFMCFRTYLDCFPKTKQDNEARPKKTIGMPRSKGRPQQEPQGPRIGEIRSAGVEKLTFWTKNQCKRGCNLCVALYWVILVWMELEKPFPLALARIGTHSIECYFGMIRSLLGGDVREEFFRFVQIKAIQIQEYMHDMHIGWVKERFRNEAGCVLPADSNLGAVFDAAQGAGLEVVDVRAAGKTDSDEQGISQQEGDAHLNEEEQGPVMEVGHPLDAETDSNGQIIEHQQEMDKGLEEDNEEEDEEDWVREDIDEPEIDGVVSVKRKDFQKALDVIASLPLKFGAGDPKPALAKTLCEAITEPFRVFSERSKDLGLKSDGYSKTGSPSRNVGLGPRIFALSRVKKEEQLPEEQNSEE